MHTRSQIRRTARWPLAVLAVLATSSFADEALERVEALRGKSVKTLRTVLAEETEWVRVHAAEMLVYNNYPEGVRDTFEAELKRKPPPKLRIGVWRVLARSAGNDEKMRKKYVGKIVAAFKDPDGPDRLHAVETLAKLGYAQSSPELISAANGDKGALQAYARWAVANSGKPEDEASLAELLQSNDPGVRGAVAYALRHFDAIKDKTFDTLVAATSAEPIDSSARIYLLSALYAHAMGTLRKERRPKAKDQLLGYISKGDKGERNEVASALARAGGLADLDTLAALLNDGEADVRAHAANAVLRIARRCF